MSMDLPKHATASDAFQDLLVARRKRETLVELIARWTGHRRQPAADKAQTASPH